MAKTEFSVAAVPAGNIAEETRERIRAWIDSRSAEQVGEESTSGTSADRIKELVAQGKRDAAETCPVYVSHPAYALPPQMIPLVALRWCATPRIDWSPEECVHYLWGWVQQIKREVHERGGWAAHLEANNRRFGEEDTTMYIQQILMENYNEVLDRNGSRVYVGATSILNSGCGYLYMRGEDVMFMGFADREAVLSMNPRQQRYGTVLKAHGYDDAEAQRRVEEYKAKRAVAKLVWYPNDLSWGELYASSDDDSNAGSCMSRKAAYYEDDQQIPGGIHPTEAYCLSLHKGIDNGLALLCAVSPDGSKTLGRAIVNTRTMKAVRWYGHNHSYRAVQRAGIKFDSEAYEGVKMAIIPCRDGEGFVAPYVDGDYEAVSAFHSDFDAGWFELQCGGGDRYLSDTEGWYEMLSDWDGEDRGYCDYRERYVRESRLEVLEFQGRRVDIEYCRDALSICYVTEEPCVTGTRSIGYHTVCAWAYDRLCAGEEVNGYWMHPDSGELVDYDPSEDEEFEEDEDDSADEDQDSTDTVAKPTAIAAAPWRNGGDNRPNYAVAASPCQVGPTPTIAELIDTEFAGPGVLSD